MFHVNVLSFNEKCISIVRYNVIGMQNFVNFCRFLWLRGKKEVLLENCTLRGIKGRESCKEQLYIYIRPKMV